MSAAVLRAVQPASAQVLAVWRAMPGAYLVLGRTTGTLPRSGSARLARETSAPGAFRSFVWPLTPEPAVAFLTVIRLAEHLRVADGAEIILRGARGADRDFPVRLAPIREEQEFGRQVALLAGSAAPQLARFILDLIRPEAEVDLRRPVSLLQSFLHHAARHEGCVELLLEIPNRVFLLQGWGPAIAPDVEIVSIGTRLTRQPGQIGEFARNDIQPPLTGSVIALPVAMARELSTTDAIYLLTEHDLFCRRIIDNRVLDPETSAGQIRHLLPRLVCPPALTTTLQHALQPQYQGLDTLNTAARPVRAALDLAVASEAAGVFLSGWLFDPTAQIARVDFCTDHHGVRIDIDFVRIQRGDVLLAFQNDPTLPPSLRSDIGFACFVPLPDLTAANPHLRFVFHDEHVAFMPLRPRHAAEPGMRERLCNSVDMHQSSGQQVIQRHLAPFLSQSALPNLPPSRIWLQGALTRQYAIVVPLSILALPRTLIASLLLEPLTEAEQIVLVCGPAWDDARLDHLAELLQFYDLPATILLLPDRVGPIEALLAASSCTQAENFILMSPSASSSRRGSRQALRDAANSSDVACPTILYEDNSIRYAGSTELDFTERAPFARQRARWLGLSAEHTATHDPAPAIGGTLECCLLTRAALPAAERARRFSTKFAQEAALFHELHHRGSRVIWLPAVSIATADDEDTVPPGSAVALADNWILRATCGDTACAS